MNEAKNTAINNSEQIVLPSKEIKTGVEPGEIFESPRQNDDGATEAAKEEAAVVSSVSASSNMAQIGAPSVAATASAVTANLTAADNDKIEPEWVEAVETVIRQTEGNPHAEEDAIHDLQVDYQKKRFGRNVSKAD